MTYAQLLLALAIIPTIVILVKTYQMDKSDKEPLGLLLKLLFYGMISVVPSVALEMFAEFILSIKFIEVNTMYHIVECFLGVGLVEELMKYHYLKKVTWKNPNFNYLFDGVIYSLFVSMGFAVIENILYVLDGGLSTAIMRGVLSIPGHAAFSIFMGYYYSLAKQSQLASDRASMKHYQRMAIIVPTIIHGFYDFCLLSEIEVLGFVFFGFVIVLDMITVKRLKQISENDYYL